jgi:pyruvate/2-oxoglutarate dehydrogenase complex dihydrolipoamide dehydrogenase (E3) component
MGLTERIDTDLAIIGAGSAGLSVAAGAAQLGVGVVLIERGLMGGDCLNHGCVPSKSLLAAAHRADIVRHAGRFGVNGHEPAVDMGVVRGHVRGVIAGIAPHDSVERFEGLGVRVLRAAARFVAPDRLRAGAHEVRAKRFVVAAGSRPAIPPIPGLDGIPYLTNETVFELGERPEHLAVIGGGPIGCELAQAFRRLGARVTLLELATILPKDDPDAVAVVRARLVADGIELVEGARITAVERQGNRIALLLANGGPQPSRIDASHLLLATGRRPNVEELGLDTAGIAHGPQGITVDRGLRTTNRRVYAIGDVIGGLQFTHMAGHHASLVVRNALFRLPAKLDTSAAPWVTFTEPELAQVGLDAATAKARGIPHEVIRWDFAENDRARTEHAEGGFIKLVVGRGGRPLGATIVGPQAGELVGLWVLAIRERIKLARIAQMVAPYPTLGEVSKRAASAYFAPRLFSARTRRLVRWLMKLP